MDMGELLPKGQLAVEPAADQRPVALVHPAQSEQPSDRTNEPPRRIDSQTTACWLKREGWVGFNASQILVVQYRWQEPVNWFTKEHIVWTVTTFTFAQRLFYSALNSELPAHIHSAPKLAKCKVTSLE